MPKPIAIINTNHANPIKAVLNVYDPESGDRILSLDLSTHDCANMIEKLQVPVHHAARQQALRAKS